MPKDLAGNFHLNVQRAHAADRMKEPGAKPKPKPEMGGGTAIAEHEPKQEGEQESISHIAIHAHPDGSYHTETHDGEKTTEHPTLGHALMHAAAHHEPDGVHMHVHKNDMGELESHHVGEDGQAHGPHSHENLEALKSHMDQFLSEEEREGEHEGYGKPEHEMESDGLTGL